MIRRRFACQKRLVSGSIYEYQPFFQQRRFARYWEKAPTTRKKEANARGHVLTPELKALYKERDDLDHKRERLHAQKRRQQGGLIPVEVLQSAHKSGFLSIAPDLAWSISERISEFGYKVDRKSVSQLAQEYVVPVNDLTPVARILCRMPDLERQNIGTLLLFALSDAGDVKATVTLIANARRQGGLHNNKVRPVLNRFRQMAAQKDDLEVMTVAGQLAEDDGRANEAIGWYERVVDKLSESEGNDDAVQGEYLDVVLHEKDPASQAVSIEKAYISLGRLLLKQHYKSEDLRLKAEKRAKEAYKVGAFKFQDSEAYHLLAEYETVWTEKWLNYHSEAASRGNVLSQYELGRFYSLPSSFLDGTHPLLQRITQYTTAADKQATFDEIWHKYNYTEDDVQDILLFGDHAKRTFSTSLPASLRTKRDQYAYAVEWLIISAEGPWDFTTEKAACQTYYLPALLRAVNLVFRELPGPNQHSYLEIIYQMREQIYGFSKELKEHALKKFPREYEEILRVFEEFADVAERGKPTEPKLGWLGWISIPIRFYGGLARRRAI